MKVFFTASLTGRVKYGDDYQNIVDAINSLGHRVIGDHILKADLERLTKESHQETALVFKNFRKMVMSADILLAEISYPSLSVGYQISDALDSGKIVIAMHHRNTSARLLEGSNNERLKIETYETESINETVKELMRWASDNIDIRFNFFITPPMIAYMDWLSEKKRIPRSVFLRGLIDKEMRLNKEYQKEIGSNGDK